MGRLPVGRLQEGILSVCVINFFLLSAEPLALCVVDGTHVLSYGTCSSLCSQMVYTPIENGLVIRSLLTFLQSNIFIGL